MNRFWQAFTNLFRIEDLRNRLFFTLALLAVYRIGAHIPTPGINTDALTELFKQRLAVDKIAVADGQPMVFYGKYSEVAGQTLDVYEWGIWAQNRGKVGQAKETKMALEIGFRPADGTAPLWRTWANRRSRPRSPGSLGARTATPRRLTMKTTPTAQPVSPWAQPPATACDSGSSARTPAAAWGPSSWRWTPSSTARWRSSRSSTSTPTTRPAGPAS